MFSEQVTFQLLNSALNYRLLNKSITSELNIK